jgi:hypothetical protein
MPFGGIIALVILLPNLLILLFPPQAAPSKMERKDSLYRVMEIVENVGRLGIFIIPFFYAIPSLRGASIDALVVMAFSLIYYYACWVRYMAKGRRYILLFAPFLGLPQPMVLSPVFYFAFAAIFLHSWPLGIATAVFALGHFYISQGEYQRSRKHAY